MGRTVSTASSAGAAASISTTLPTSDSITTGDLVSLASDGNAYWAADPTIAATTATLPRPAYLATGFAVKLLADTTTTVGTTSYAAYSMSTQSVGFAALSNGDYVVARINTSSAIEAKVYGADAVLKSSITAITGITAVFGISLCALTGGGFAIFYLDNTTGYPMVGIYTNTCTVTTSPVAIDGANSANSGATKPIIIGLSGGGIAASWANAGGVRRIAILSATASIVTAAANFASFAVSNIVQEHQMVALTGGGFIATYKNPMYYTRVFSALGVAGTLIDHNTALTANATVPITVCALSGGGFAVAAVRDYWASGAPSGVAVAVYNASGTLQGSVQSLDTGNYTYSPITSTLAIVGLTGGAAQVLWSSMASGTGYTQAKILTQQISAAGALVGSITTVWGTATANATIALAATPDGGSAAWYSIYGGGNTTQECHLQKITAAGAISGSTVSLTMSAYGADRDRPALLSLGNDSVVGVLQRGISAYTVYTTPYFASAYVYPRVPVGIATAAPSGGTVAVQITGSIATRLTFAQPWSCEYTSKSPPGQSMSVVGNTAVMLGVQFAVPKPPININ